MSCQNHKGCHSLTPQVCLGARSKGQDQSHQRSSSRAATLFTSRLQGQELLVCQCIAHGLPIALSCCSNSCVHMNTRNGVRAYTGYTQRSQQHKYNTHHLCVRYITPKHACSCAPMQYPPSIVGRKTNLLTWQARLSLWVVLFQANSLVKTPHQDLCRTC
jgi:hypothetical protein